MNRSVKLISSLILIMVVSCNDPQTVVTNYVHTDGSVTRKIEMKSNEKKSEKRFKASDVQVPFDSSWIIRDSSEVNAKGDTTWVRRAEKLFHTTDELNLAYKSDSGSDKGTSRYARFNKRFRWFNTEYRFSENIEKKLSFGFPVKNFLNADELLYFYSPESMKNAMAAGSDSLKFKVLKDSVKLKTDKWVAKNLVSEWIGEFTRLTAGKAESGMSVQALKSHENDFVKLIEDDDKNLDSLWKSGILLKEFMGEANARIYRTEADSALSMVTNSIFSNFDEYSLRIVMPGRLLRTNGFIDSSHLLIWPVKSDFFLTEEYKMWAESKIPNRWAWIVSGVFLVFVFSGVIIRIKKKD